VSEQQEGLELADEPDPRDRAYDVAQVREPVAAEPDSDAPQLTDPELGGAGTDREGTEIAEEFPPEPSGAQPEEQALHHQRER
jgi:hypothetical protein